MPIARHLFFLCLLFSGIAQLGAWAQSPPATPAPDSSNTADTYVKFGIANGSKGDLDSAIASFDQAIKIDPKWAPAYENRGYAKSLQHKLTEAIADYDTALQIDPKYADAYYNRGTAKGQQGDFDGAIADYSRALELNPKHALAYYNRGHAKYFKGDLNGALADNNQAITLDPNSPLSYFIRGLIRHALDDREGSKVDFQKSATSGFAYGALWLWIVEMENGDHGAAQEDLKNLSNQSTLFKPNDWPTQIASFLLGKISQDQLMAQVKTDVKSDAEKTDRLCEAWFYAGMSKRFSGDSAGALACQQQAVATGAKNVEEFIEAQRQLTKLQTP